MFSPTAAPAAAADFKKVRRSSEFAMSLTSEFLLEFGPNFQTFSAITDTAL